VFRFPKLRVMSDEPTKFILGDTVISASEEHPGGRSGFFGRKRRARTALTHCENCGTQLTGLYCAQCGQAAIDYRRSFRHVIVDLLDSFLNWDSKFIATIALLIVKPWRLTNEFLAGRRVEYLHPARLYLLASILFFFVATYGAKSIHVDPTAQVTPEVKAQIDEDLKKEDLTPEQRARVQKALEFTKMSPQAVAKTAKKIREKDAKRQAHATPVASAAPESSPKKEADTEKEIDSNPDVESKSNEGPTLQFGSDSGESKSNLGKWFEARAKEKMGEHGTKMQLFIVTLVSNLPYMMLGCIPLFAFVLKILYIRKGIFYIDHLVYALHIHTFLYLAVMIIIASTIGLNRLIPGWSGLFIVLLWTLFAVQIFLSIRRVYKQSWFFTIFKFFAGGFAYLIVLFVALAATFLITVALP
jgi:hypothetical protein